MNLQKYKYILFDFDGTLMDTSEGIYNAFDYTCDHYKIERKGKAVYKTLIGPPLADSFKNAFGFDEKKAKEAIKVYREYYTPKGLYEVKVYDGVKEMLKSLYDKGFILAVASSKPERFVKELLNRFELEQYFTFAGGSDMAETRVKKNQIIDYVLSQLGCNNKAECLMVGDRKFDVEGAKEAGVECTGILWGFGSKEELDKSGAIFTVSSPDEFLN